MTTRVSQADCRDRRVRANQERLAADLEQPYDFIVCDGVTASRLIAGHRWPTWSPSERLRSRRST